MMVPTATSSGRSSRPRRRDCGMGCSAPCRLGHRAGDCVRVQSHEVIIAVTRAEVTPRHNFVIRVANGTANGRIAPCRRREGSLRATIRPGPGRRPRPRCEPAGTGGRHGDDQ